MNCESPSCWMRTADALSLNLYVHRFVLLTIDLYEVLMICGFVTTPRSIDVVAFCFLATCEWYFCMIFKTLFLDCILVMV